MIPGPEVVVADAICRDRHGAHGGPVGELWPDECADFDLLVHGNPRDQHFRSGMESDQKTNSPKSGGPSLYGVEIAI